VRIRVGLRSNPNRFEGWAHVNGFSWHKLRLHIPENESLRRELVRRHYGLPFAGHFAERTSDLLGRKYYGKGMRQYVEEYYRAYGVCHDSRVLCGKIQGELQPLEALTEQLADTSIREIACFHGLQVRIASDRGSISPTSFGGTCCTHSRSQEIRALAYHSQNDGQTERLNSVLKQYLRSYVNFDQDDWVEWLPLADATHQWGIHHSDSCLA
jgi:hypothetical protein